ncbi:MAG: antA/AntB antirepressor family protein [Flavobacteriales bacterium]
MNMPIPIDVAQAHIADEEITAVNARDLHKFLEVGRDFSNWIKDRIKTYGFVENFDFVVVQNLTSPDLARSKSRVRKLTDYTISIRMAQELCMIEKTEKGRECRRYFIECERQLRQTTNSLHYKLAEAELDVKSISNLASFHGSGLRQVGRFDKPAAIARRDDLMRQLQPLLPFSDELK